MLQKSKLPREFWSFVSAKLLFTLGYRMITTIIIYQVFHLASTFMVGIAGLTEFVPAVLTAFYAGHIIDNKDKRKLLLGSYFFYALCGFALAAISSDYLQFADKPMVKLILAIIFFTGIIRSFAGPSGTAMIAAIVKREDLQKAISFNSSSYLLSSVIGHATGGLIIAFFGIAEGYLLAAILISASFFIALSLQPKPPVLRVVKERKIDSIKGGFKFVWSNKTLLGVISLDLFAVLFGGAVAFIPEIAETVLHTGPMGYGFLNAAMDMGALLSILTIVAFPMRRKQGLKMLLAVGGFGMFIIVFGLSEVYWLSFLALAAAGFLDGISVVVRGTVAQLQTPDELRGRVSSINMIFINSSNELGQFESGLTSRLFGTVPAIVIGGAMSMLVVAGSWIGFKKLKDIEY